jgi:hypothetical protein
MSIPGLGLLQFTAYDSTNSLNLLTVDLTVAAAVVPTVHAPPAIVFLHPLQCQIPTAVLFTESFPQNEHVYLACCVISIFLICLRRDAPYLVPYLPTTPAFLVLFYSI